MNFGIGLAGAVVGIGIGVGIGLAYASYKTEVPVKDIITKKKGEIFLEDVVISDDADVDDVVIEPIAD